MQAKQKEKEMMDENLADKGRQLATRDSPAASSLARVNQRAAAASSARKA
jgi:hypothetical protein